jgi:hypothetical protein
MIYASPIPKHLFSWNNDNEAWIETETVSVYDLNEQNVTFPVDPLVISCCRYRRSNKESLDYDDEAAFSTIDLYSAKHQTITADDFALADSIRTYYKGKVTFALLRGEQLSKFKQDLAALLALEWTDTREITISQKYIGMIYKLPYFYEHDTTIENEVFDSRKLQPIQTRYRHGESVALTYIRSVARHQKRNPSISYWFKDSSGTRFRIDVDKTNSLIPAWEQLIKSGPVHIEGGYTELSHNTLHFYKVAPRWKIVS